MRTRRGRGSGIVAVVLAIGVGGCAEAGTDPASPGPSLVVSLAVEAGAPAVNRVVIHVDGGPTRLSPTTAAPGEEVTIPGLAPGTYTVALEGFLDAGVSWYDETTVAVRAGAASRAELRARSFVPELASVTAEALPGDSVDLAWTTVAGAVAYRLERSGPADSTTWQTVADSLPSTTVRILVDRAGHYRFRVRAINRFGSPSLPTPTGGRIHALSPLQVDDRTLPLGIEARPYTSTLSATGGGRDVAWRVSGGALPPGVTLTADGRLGGTPQGPGDVRFEVEATSAGGRLRHVRSFDLSVMDAGARLVAVPPSAILPWPAARFRATALRLDGAGEEAGTPLLRWTPVEPDRVAVDTGGEVRALTAGVSAVTVRDEGTSPPLETALTVDVRDLFEPASELQFFGTTYVVTRDAWSWTEARALAEAVGGRLVVVETDAENSFLGTALRDRPDLWIGFHDRIQEGRYEWVNGSPQTTTPWHYAGGEPSAGPGEDCVMLLSGSSGRWADEVCANTHPALVEFSFSLPLRFDTVFAAEGVVYGRTTGYMDWTSAGRRTRPGWRVGGDRERGGEPAGIRRGGAGPLDRAPRPRRGGAVHVVERARGGFHALGRRRAEQRGRRGLRPLLEFRRPGTVERHRVLSGRPRRSPPSGGGVHPSSGGASHPRGVRGGRANPSSTADQAESLKATGSSPRA